MQPHRRLLPLASTALVACAARRTATAAPIRTRLRLQRLHAVRVRAVRASRCRARSASNFGWEHRSRPRSVAPGDLVFFTTTDAGTVARRRSRSAAIEFVHAPSSTGVVRVERSELELLVAAVSRRAPDSTTELDGDRAGRRRPLICGYAALNWPLRIRRRDVSLMNWRTCRSSSRVARRLLRRAQRLDLARRARPTRTAAARRAARCSAAGYDGNVRKLVPTTPP